MTALGLGPTQRAEIDRNRAVRSSPVMPALDRYTGVLFDGLGVETLSTPEREFASRTLVMHSALFGLISAGDGIPAYRLSHNSKLPGASLRALWRSQISAILAARSDLVIDLRSESYVSLGPAPSASYVRVVSEGPAGTRVALSHFNKKGKGEFARAVVASGIEHGSVDSLLEWARSSGIRLDRAEHGGLDLVV